LRREARITAALDHPGIVPVYDLGEDADGRPYYVMRLVRGRSLSDAIESAATYPERLHLVRGFLAACDAVAFAHAAGVVHRDIKPDNILVGPYGETQVMDWGLARTLRDDDWDGVLTKDFRTREGAILGTPAYMSPEQATGEEVGPGVDVWALGAVLYEILAGKRAVKGPSQREMIAQILSGSRVSLRSAVPEVDSGLVEIVERALRRDPSERYPDAGAMAQALEAWFEGRRLAQPLREPPRAQRAPWVAAAAAVLVAAGIGWWVGGLGAGVEAPTPQQMVVVQDALVVQAQQATDGRDRVRAERLAADALSIGEHPGARGILAAHGLGPIPQRLSSHPVPPCLESVLDPQGDLFVCAMETSLDVTQLDGSPLWSLPIRARRVGVDPSHTRIVARNDSADRNMYLDAANGAMVTVESSNFSLLLNRGGVSLVPDRFVRLLNGPASRFPIVTARTGVMNQYVSGCSDIRLDWVLETAEEGQLLLVCADRSIVRHDASTGHETPFLPARDTDSIVWTGATDPTGRWLVLGGVEGDIELVDIAQQKRMAAFDLSTRMIRDVSVSNDGATLAAMDAAGTVWVVPAGDTDGRYRLPGRARSVGFAPDGTLWVLEADRLVSWSTPLPVARTRQATPTGTMDAAWSPHGIGLVAGDVRFMTASADPRNVRTPEQLEHVFDPGPPPELRSVAWAPDGSLLVAGHNIGLHRMTADTVEFLTTGVSDVAMLASGHTVIIGHLESNPFVLRPDGTPIEGLSIPGWSAQSVDPTSNNKYALLVGREGSGNYRLVDGDPPVLEQLPEMPGGRSAVLADDGTTLYIAKEGGVFVRQVQGAPGSETPLFATDRVGHLTLSPDGRWLLMGTVEGQIDVHSTADGALRASIDAHERRVSAMAVSPDGDRLISGSWDRTAKLWDLSVLDGERGALIAAVQARWAGLPEVE